MRLPIPELQSRNRPIHPQYAKRQLNRGSGEKRDIDGLISIPAWSFPAAASLARLCDISHENWAPRSSTNFPSIAEIILAE
jgi:hypothetical protein